MDLGYVSPQVVAFAFAALAVLVVQCAAEATPAVQSIQQPRYETTLRNGTLKYFDVDIHYYLYDVRQLEGGGREVPTAVFLHGAKFASDYWLSSGTLQMVAESGVRALAIDLPGYGRTRALPYSDNNMRAELLLAVVEHASQRNNDTIILISPSMSGRYSIPFLDRHGTLVTSYVAIAPIGVKDWGGPWEDTHKRVCALAIYGSDDAMAPQADILIKYFHYSYKVIVPNAGHRCYEDQPALFNPVLLKFLRKCRKGLGGEHIVASDKLLPIRIEAEGAAETAPRRDL